MRIVNVAGAVVSVLAMMNVPAAAQSRVSCDRTCLTGFLDRYLDALVAQDPTRLPLSRTVKFTENGQRLDLGDGLWHTVTGKGSYRVDMADVEAGQAVAMGTIREAEMPTIIVLRLGVVDQRIAEIETLVIRNQDAAQSLDTIGSPRRAWLTAVPEQERHSRDDLVRIAIAFAFFDNASGEARNVTLRDGRKVVSGPSIPWTWQIAEFFKIEKGLIGPVESVLHQVPYGMGSGWSTWEDAMSSRPRW
jgi:hypothetical protein